LRFFFIELDDECLDAQKLTLHAAAASKADIRGMAENCSPNDPAERVVETTTQVKDEATNGNQDDIQTMEPGEAPKPDGAGVKKETTREDSQDATEPAKQEEKPQPSRLKVMWDKLGLNPLTLILMFK